jgi:ATP-dependent RNA helicase RhlE
MRFAQYDIAPEIKANLDELGFKRPTDIQFKAIPLILDGEDLLAIAQTGTGKTAAFVIPVLEILSYQNKTAPFDGIKCIVMAPTHELALQITGVFNEIGKNTGIMTLCVHGGVEQAGQIEQLEKGIDIMVATPGRMFDLVSQGFIKLSTVGLLVVDEADHMLDLGFLKDIQDLIKFLPRKRQTLFFSATINEDIKKLAYSLVHNPVRIQISPKDPVAKNINHSVAFISMDDKRFFLERLITENPDRKILVFVRTKVRAERVCSAMERIGVKTISIHGDKIHEDRRLAMKQFRDGVVKILIATDVSARGIDIPDVDYVVNYDLPEQVENYVHRVGRTGRADKKGNAVSFCSAEEKALLDEIEKYLDKPVKVLDISKNEYKKTLDFTEDTDDNWKALLIDAEKTEKLKKKKKKK